MRHELTGNRWTACAMALLIAATALPAAGDDAGAAGKVAVLEPLPVERVVVLEPLPSEEGLLDTVLEGRLSTGDEAFQPSQQMIASGFDADEIIEMVSSWAYAWSEQAPERYLSHYASSFKTPSGKTREQWESERQQRLSQPRFIEVEVAFESEPHRLAPGRALVSFRQNYTSDRFSDVVLKTLELVREGPEWKILEEVAEAVEPSMSAALELPAPVDRDEPETIAAAMR